VLLAVVEAVRENGSGARGERPVGTDDLGTAFVLEFELEEQRRPVGVVMALALPAEPPEGPPFADDRTDGVRAGDDPVGHVVGADRETMAVGRPARGQHLVADTFAVQVGLDQPDRGDVQGRATGRAVDGEFTPEVRGRRSGFGRASGRGRDEPGLPGG